MNINEVDSYLRSLQEQIQRVQRDSSPSDKLLLAQNVLNEIKDYIPVVAFHQTLSKYLEKLVSLLAHSLLEDPTSDLQSKLDACRLLLTTLIHKSDVELLGKDVFGSHVLQTVLQYTSLCLEHGANIDDLLQHLSKIIEERYLFELIHHTCGSHLIRSLIKTLAGVIDVDAFVKNRKSADESHMLRPANATLPEWRRDKLIKWANLLQKDIKGTLATAQSTATAFILLKCCRMIDNKIGIELLKKIQHYAKDACMYCKYASYALENTISLMTQEELDEFIDSVPNLQEFATNRLANFSICALARQPNLRERHLNRLIGGLFFPSNSHVDLDFSALIVSDSSPIIWRLCEACLLQPNSQSTLVEKLFNTLGIDKEDVGFWPKILQCMPKGSTDDYQIRATGCSILLFLLRFNTIVIKRLLLDFKNFIKQTKTQELWPRLATDSLFSRVLQMLLDVKLKLISDRIVIKLFKALREHAVQLSLDRNGAFVMSSLFKALSPAMREELLLELVPSCNQIVKRNKKYAEIIGLEAFKTNDAMWREKQEKASNVRGMFRDIVE
ncbi:bifunctional Nucleolar protein 9/Pumilio RNA-binding repeat/Armadillo-type fold/Armadillo-like helical [Babesia duncani]|uniref:Bifunctional Nucleolar protein 9/Pumilio RNA-binding repeat/Armadillo-type fold/Armadillo-like helical n=1 Tax=Babesia duncani TaxID=323732 RepID=A0AAD9PLA0_9APIC|nr:bifunctional Nucleolar protein 9/Pumilio RNA-binding repeat/Armadillo-type fold/Armadillo-like helical [Babesia duncani]